ncbi:protein-export chaperone SecB [Amylibacter sp.]|nr:protein-export chaperone SecB [Amylibacter sp.]MDC0094992.1 protein-export chaperone SecB [Amylibacter sp.]
MAEKEEKKIPPKAPSMKCLHQYIRDLSFENIAAQKNLGDSSSPEINVQVNLDARKGDSDNYEVILKLTVNADSNEKKVFLLEIDYAGVFHVENVPKEQLHPFLMIECPRMLFPFVRQIVRNTTADGGYPPLNVDPIDFMALYRSELQRQAAEKATVN